MKVVTVVKKMLDAYKLVELVHDQKNAVVSALEEHGERSPVSKVVFVGDSAKAR